MADNLSVVGEPEWIAEFLLRVEASAMSMAASLREQDKLAALISEADGQGRLFDLLSRPEISAYFNQAQIANWTDRVLIGELLDHDAGEIDLLAHNCSIMRVPHPIFVRVLQNMKT